MALLARRSLLPLLPERSSRRSRNVFSKAAARKTRLGLLCTAASSSSDAFHEKLPMSIFGSDNVSRDGLEVKSDVDRSAVAEDGVAMEKASVDSGKVLGVREGIAMIEGISAEAPMGTELTFQNGQRGVLLWRHTTDICFALVADVDLPAPDDTVHCLFGEVFETEERDGRRNYEFLKVATGQHGMNGEVLGNVLSTLVHIVPEEKSTPLLNKQLDISDRQCIFQPLTMQHKGIDILTPIGRGQCILLISENSQELSRLTEHMLTAQASASVSCIYACVGKSIDERNAVLSRLRESEGVKGTVFVAASDEESIGEQFASLCAALAFGGTYLSGIPLEDITLCFAESIRDEAGGDALVIIDSLRPLVDVWNLMQKFTVDVRRTSNEKGKEKENLAEIDGTLMASETAERRRFFSSVLQRASKASLSLGGGSLTLVPIVNGSPASGQQQHRQELQTKLDAIEKDPKLSETLKAKLRDKLRPRDSWKGVSNSDTSSLPTFIVEEFMSIADGQIVIKEIDENDGVSVDPLQSFSRIGARAYPPALEDLAPTIRLELAQAADAFRFGSSVGNPASETWNSRIEVLKQALVQKSTVLFPVSHQLVTLLALRTERAQMMSKDEISSYLSDVLSMFLRENPDVLQRIDASNRLKLEWQQEILEMLNRRM